MSPKQRTKPISYLERSNNIRIKNLYYLLSYAFQVLREDSYKNVGTERFEHSADLCAAILIRGLSLQVKQGLHREYISVTEEMPSIRGQIEMRESLVKSRLNKRMVCTYDEFSEDNILNQLLKATAELLLVSDIDEERKIQLKKLLVFFTDVKHIELRTVNWNFQFNRFNRSYQMLTAICFLVYKGLLQTTSEGNTYLLDFVDEQRMSHLYEKFLLEYYKFHWGKQFKVSSPEIAWQLDEGSDIDQLPTMKSDVVLKRGNDYLIIDAKYYSKNLQENLGKKTVWNNNLYQMYAYVKNQEAQLQSEHPHSVSGLLMYAMTDSEEQPHLNFINTGNKICARAIDLNTEWSVIREQLDGVISEFFTLN